MSMRAGLVPSVLPFKTRPPVGSIVILERPVLLFQADPVVGPWTKRSFFCRLKSWLAARRAKLSSPPPTGAPLLVTVKLNWTGLPQSVGVPEAGLHKTPGVEEPVTDHCPPVYVTL